jgi:hypothetical protein
MAQDKAWITVQVDRETVDRIAAFLEGKDLTRSQFVRGALDNQLRIVDVTALPHPDGAQVVPVVSVQTDENPVGAGK